MAADAFGNALGNSIVDKLAPQSAQPGHELTPNERRMQGGDTYEHQRRLASGEYVPPAVSLPEFTLDLDSNPEFFANLPMPTAQYAEPPARNVPRPAAVAARDPVSDYASATIGDFWRDGVRQASYSGIDRQFADAFDGLLANPGVAPSPVVPGQELSDALYLAGPVPIARYDLGIASLTVNGALNFVNGVANAGLNALGVLTEPLDRYQGEITSVETGLGPFGMAAAAPTLLLGRLSSAIRAESALNARFLSNGRFALESDQIALAQKISFEPSLTTVDRYFGMQAGEIIAADPTARAFYTRLQAQGTDIRFVNDTSLDAMGVFDGYRNSVTVNLAEHSTAEEIVSTLIHEGTHQSRFFRGARLGTQYEEYVAFRNEALFNLGRRPTLVERQVIWNDVQQLYPELQIGPVPFGGQR